MYKALWDAYYNPTIPSDEDEEEAEDNEEDTHSGEIAAYAFLSIMEGARDPMSFKEAWFHPDPVKREKWRAAIGK